MAALECKKSGCHQAINDSIKEDDAPLLMHNPKRSDTKPYLSRDEKLRSIIDDHENIIFISGHTHVSMESPVKCVEHDAQCNNIYINDGSICPTTLLTAEGVPEAEPAVGNVVEILLSDDQLTVTAISVKDGQSLTQCFSGCPK